MRKSLGITLAAAMAVTQITPISVFAAEGESGSSTKNLIKNPSFEELDYDNKTINNWVISEDTSDYTSDSGSKAAAYKWIGQNTSKDGSYALQFYSDNNYTANISQEINDVPDGKYKLSAFIKGEHAVYGKIYTYCGQQSNEKTYVFNSNDSNWTNEISGEWQEVTINDIEVNNGTVTIGVKIETGQWDNAGKSLQMDAFSLVKTGDLTSPPDEGEKDPTPAPGTGDEEPDPGIEDKNTFTNGSFEEFPDSYIPSGWITDGTAVYAKKRADAKDGEHTLEVGGVETNTNIYQEVTGLIPGKNYVFTVYAQTGGPEECFIYASSNAQEETRQNIASGWSWQENKLVFKAGSDGKATVGIHIKSAADVWSIYDSCSLELAQEYDSTQFKPDNSSFEEVEEGGAVSGWAISLHDTAAKIDLKEDGAHTGSKYLNITGTSDYKAEISQEVTGLEPGWYYLTAYANKTKGGSDKDQKSATCMAMAQGSLKA